MAFQPMIEEMQAEMAGIKLPDGFLGLQRGMKKIGLETPIERGLGMTAATAAVLYSVRPRFAFDEYGPRPFSLASNSGNGTLFHPAVLSLAAGTLSALFL